MLYFPHSKINLGLRVLGKREDGFHDIESVFVSIPFHDVLEIIPTPNFHFQYTGVDHIAGDNLVVKAYEALKKVVNIPPVTIHLHKNIPMGAGVGGGSADATFTLRGLNEQFNLELSYNQLHEIALSIGSDCPFFLKDVSQYVTGRGENLKEVDLNLEGYYLVIVNPGIHISTKEAYQNLQIPKREESTSFKELIKLPITKWQGKFENDFEKYAFEKYPEIKQIKESLHAHGAVFASMTGTGSTVYGIFEKEEEIPSFENYFQKIMKF